jgi:hypothetical protein
MFFRVFSSKLSAGGVNVAAQGSPHSGRNAAILQNFLEPGHRIAGAGL